MFIIQHESIWGSVCVSGLLLGKAYVKVALRRLDDGTYPMSRLALVLDNDLDSLYTDFHHTRRRRLSRLPPVTCHLQHPRQRSRLNMPQPPFNSVISIKRIVTFCLYMSFTVLVSHRVQFFALLSLYMPPLQLIISMVCYNHLILLLHVDLLLNDIPSWYCCFILYCF